MSRKRERQTPREARHDEQTEIFTEYSPTVNKKPLQALTEAQGHYILSIKSNTITFGLGSAGTGKSYVCGALACDALLDKKIERIIVTRPCVEAGEHLGFLPGELNDKFYPYLEPLLDVFHERLGKSFTQYLIKAERIKPIPLAYMRGMSLKKSFVILDEAQNTTPTQMKMFLTRLGEGSRIVINGDPSQKDIPRESGLDDAVYRLKPLKSIGTIRFERSDVVRHSMVQKILEAYEY